MKAKKQRRSKELPRARVRADKARDNLPEWPVGKRFPDFKTLAEEEKFYVSWSFAEDMGAGTEDFIYEPRVTQQ